jgi:hypothetical protein
MSAQMRSVTAALALVVVAAGFSVYLGRMDRAGPARPTPALPAARPPAVSPGPLTAREILGQRVVLDLRGDQIVRLEALDETWRREAGELEALVRQAELEFSRFASESQRSRGASLPEIQRRSVAFSGLSAEVRQRRQQHAEAAIGVLDESQRLRVARSPRPLVEGRSHEPTGH